MPVSILLDGIKIEMYSMITLHTTAFAGVLANTGDMGLQPLDLDPDVLFAESKN